jgi:DNA primase catalytic core
MTKYIYDIKENNTLRDELDSIGLELKKSGFCQYKAKCPLHNEKTASFTYYAETDSFYCYGCGQGGDIIDFIRIKQGFSNNNEASRYLLNRSKGVGVEERASSGLTSIGEVLKRKQKRIKEDIEDGAPTTDVYTALKEFCGELSEDVRGYLHSRGFNDDTIKHFQIFDIKDYIKTKEFLHSKFSKERLQQSGLWEKSRNKFIYTMHKIIIPFIKDGEIVSLAGRYFQKGSGDVPKYIDEKGYAKKFKNPLKADQPLCKAQREYVYNEDILKTLKEGDEIYLCEGSFDTMALHQYGKKAIGLRSLISNTEVVIPKLKDFKLIICFDNRQEGDDIETYYANKVKNQFYKLTKRGADRLIMPKQYKDVNEYLLKTGRISFDKK